MPSRPERVSVDDPDRDADDHLGGRRHATRGNRLVVWMAMDGGGPVRVVGVAHGPAGLFRAVPSIGGRTALKTALGIKYCLQLLGHEYHVPTLAEYRRHQPGQGNDPLKVVHVF